MATHRRPAAAHRRIIRDEITRGLIAGQAKATRSGDPLDASTSGTGHGASHRSTLEQLILRWANPVRSAAVGSVASPSRRMASGVVDAVIVAAAGLGVRRLRGRPWHDASSGAQWDSLAVAGCYFVAGMVLAGRTAGQAVLGLRMVNEVTHGRPGWRAVMIRWAVCQPPQVLLIAVSGSSSVRRALEQLRELQPDVEELRRQHGRNQRELKQSLMDLFEARGIAPFKGSCPLLAAMLVGVAYEGIVTAGVLRPPRRQGLHDRLAHILVMDGKEVG